MRRVLVVLVALMIVSATPAIAITYGELDKEKHPQVGLMVAFDQQSKPMWSCSGTMISPRVYLTAGHCTYGADSVQIWFDADVEDGMPGNGFGSDGGWAGDVSGTPQTHHDYDPEGAWWLADVGVVELNSDGPGPYAKLPAEGALDKYAERPKKDKVRFTAVGYGMQRGFKNQLNWKNSSPYVRMYSEPKLIQINVPGYTGDRNLILSNNTRTGGTCFGDSGGPNFLQVRDGLTVAGVTSFGKNGQCAGQGGVLRMDHHKVRDWVEGFLPQN